jgi:hypothetical protein
MLSNSELLIGRLPKNYLNLNCHQNKNLENQESILCDGFELAKSHLISALKVNINKRFNSNHDFAAKKLICSIFKLLFWRLDFLLFLFLYQNKKRK